MTAKRLRKRNMKESRLTASGGSGSSSGCLRNGIKAAREVKRGIRAFKRR